MTFKISYYSLVLVATALLSACGEKAPEVKEGQ